MPKIFISYGRDGSHGQNLATQAQQQLQDAGFEVFRDVNGLKPGDVWYSKLEFELDSSDLVVLVISEKVRTSEWVHNEFSMAKEIGLPIIPVIAEPVRMPLWLRHLQALDFSEQPNWHGLFEAIVGHVGVVQTTSELQGSFVGEVLEKPEPDEIERYRAYVESVSSDDVSTKEAIDDYRSYIERSEGAFLGSPLWGSHAGKDQYGHYADLDINNVIQRFRLINPGTFQMGSPTGEKEREPFGAKETLHQVTISNAFWLADTACTQALWQAVMGKNPSAFTKNANDPVECVSWDDTHAFFQALAQMKPELSFQLPTEAQWEYACRAGTQTPFSFGGNITPEQVNYDGNFPYASGAKGVYRKKTVSVKSLPANPWGLYEMHGNVWEWCRDSFQEDLGGQTQTDPIMESGEGARRVIRGGSWFITGRGVRSAYRDHYAPGNRNPDLGFRLFLVN